MAVYKIPQDVEADDKFVGPLSFKQFIFSGIAVVSAYLSFLSLTKGFWPALIFFLPVITVSGFLGFPWGRDQPTEVWLAARIRFMLKPRKRIWNQSGMKELVTITVPKRIEKRYTDGLSQTEVSSRLTGLADLLDSRGWAVKNVNVNLYANPVVSGTQESDDRLVNVAALPQEVVDVTANDDVLDEHVNPTAQHFEEMIRSSEEKHRQELMQHMQAVRETPAAAAPAQSATAPAASGNAADFWFLQSGGHGDNHPSSNQLLEEIATKQPAPDVGFTTFQAPSLVAPHSSATTPAPVTQESAVAGQMISSQDEQNLLAKIHKEHDATSNPFGHIKTIMPLGETAAAGSTPTPMQLPINPAAPITQNMPAPQMPQVPQTSVTPPVNPAIISLANNDDLNVATIARQADKSTGQQAADGEVVISLH